MKIHRPQTGPSGISHIKTHRPKTGRSGAQRIIIPQTMNYHNLTDTANIASVNIVVFGSTKSK